MKRFSIREQMNGVEEPPGKVWFWELESAVIDAERCIQCGTCVAACPSNSLGVNEDTGLPELVKMCTGCSLCWDFCPRAGLRYEALWPPSTMTEEEVAAQASMATNGHSTVASTGVAANGSAATEDRGNGSAIAEGNGNGRRLSKVAAGAKHAVEGEPEQATRTAVSLGPSVKSDAADTYWKITGGPPGDGLGSVVERYAVRAAAKPDDVQDGGAVTALLSALLVAGEIDGALVSRPSSDPDEPWKGVAHVATTPAELVAAAGSFYNQTMALAELDLSRYALPAKPRLAVVGTPCEIQGIRAMQARRWPTGVHRVDAVVLTIALMCTKSFDYEGLILKEFMERRRVDMDRVSKIDVIHGKMIVEYRDGHRAVDEPVKRFHGSALKGCDECADFLGRSADLSMGSVGSMTGWTSVLIRTERGRLAFERARPKLDVRGLDDPDALVRLDNLDKKIAFRTLQRDFDPDGELFIDFEEHVRSYAGSDRAPVDVTK